MVKESSQERRLLRQTRERLGITRGELARRSGVPTDTLRRWEDGTRNPTLPRLLRVLEALDCPSAEANAILAAAGYPPERTLFPLDRFPNYFYTVQELQHTVEAVPWPEFVLNDNIEVVAANSTVQALWRIDFAQEQTRRTPPRMNLLSVASDHLFTDHVVNWDECIATLVSVFKGGLHTLDEPDPYFDAVLAEFATGDPTFLARLIEVFAETPAREPKCRWTYRVVWKDNDFGEMRFIAIVNTASEPDALGFNDWIPLDADSWDNLENVKGLARKMTKGRDGPGQPSE